MNPRIDILLDQAGLTPVQEMFEPELYRFAELIVRECVPFVGNENSLAVKSMLKHFEVMQ